MSEELNELASAYVDGEVTPQEAALVEQSDYAEPLISDFRVLSTKIGSVEPPTPELRERHIGAALRAFNANVSQAVTIDMQRPTKESSPSNVVPLRSSIRTAATSASTNEVGKSTTRSRYRWLTPVASAAAFALVVGVGINMLMASSSESDFATASDAAAQATESEFSTSATFVDSESVVSEEALTAMDDAAEDIVATDEAADETISQEELELVADPPAAEPDSDPGNRNFAGSKLLNFSEVPSPDQLSMIVAESTLSTNYFATPCSRTVVDPAGGELVGYLPISVAGSTAELFVFTSDTAEDGVVVVPVDTNCVVIPSP